MFIGLVSTLLVALTSICGAPSQRDSFPSKDKVWIFVLAGQSNMAGRGLIEEKDTITNSRILTINSENEVIVAKEPLHFYEPKGAGLDCGMSFGLEMLKKIPDDVTILLIPTAVGGSSISQWINDEMHRGVALFSNFSERVKASLDYGTLKGILWHQGESDASPEKTAVYEENLEVLFGRFREVAGSDSLPIVMGKLGSFFFKPENWERVNEKMISYVASDEFCEIIETSDLDHKGDRIHFNSEAQRAMGKRFAKAMWGLIE